MIDRLEDGQPSGPSGHSAPSVRLPAEAAVSRLAIGYQVSQALYTAVALGIPDLLADGPRPVQSLAEASQAHAPALLRLLKCLVAFDEGRCQFRSRLS